MRKFVLSMILVCMVGLVVSCDSSSFEVEPSGYQNLDDLGLCVNNYIDPPKNIDDYCNQEALNEKLLSYISFLTDSMDVVEDSLTAGASNSSFMNETGNQVFAVTITFSLDTTYSLEIYSDLELAFLQVIQEFDDFTNQNTVISMNIYLNEYSGILLSGTVNASKSDTVIYRKITNKHLTESTADTFTSYLNDYISEADYEPFTQTVFSIETMDSLYFLDLNHSDEEYSFISQDAEYSADDFKTLIEGLLPDYTYVDFVMPGTKA